MELGQNKFDYYKDKWPDQITIGNGLQISPNISFSKAKMVLTCPLQYKYKYELKIPVPIGTPLLMGKVFDGLCSYGTEALTRDKEVADAVAKLDAGDVQIIKDRYIEFKPDRPEGEPQVPIYKEIMDGKWIVIGFIDLLPTGFPEAPITDWKWAMRPWDARKFGDNKFQGHFYCWAMGGDWARFLVGNRKQAGIQGLAGEFDVSAGPQDLARIEKYIFDAIHMIESGERRGEPSPDNCKWCDFKERCPDIYGG